MIKHYNFSDFKVWDKVKQLNLHQNSTLKIPRKLDSLEEFPLDSLLGHLGQLRPMEDMSTKAFSAWGYMVVFIGTVTIFVLSVIIYCKSRKSLLTKLMQNKAKTTKRKQITMMSSNATNDDKVENRRYNDETATCMPCMVNKG